MSDVDDYLLKILNRQAVNTGPKSLGTLARLKASPPLKVFWGAA
jgi:hypothetical protein